MKEKYCSAEIMELLIEKNYPLEKVFKQDGRPVYLIMNSDNVRCYDCSAYYVPTINEVINWLEGYHWLFFVISPNLNEFNVLFWDGTIVKYSPLTDNHPASLITKSRCSSDKRNQVINNLLIYSLENLI